MNGQHAVLRHPRTAVRRSLRLSVQISEIESQLDSSHFSFEVSSLHHIRAATVAGFTGTG